MQQDPLKEIGQEKQVERARAAVKKVRVSNWNSILGRRNSNCKGALRRETDESFTYKVFKSFYIHLLSYYKFYINTVELYDYIFIYIMQNCSVTTADSL